MGMDIGLLEPETQDPAKREEVGGSQRTEAGTGQGHEGRELYVPSQDVPEVQVLGQIACGTGFVDW